MAVAFEIKYKMIKMQIKTMEVNAIYCGDCKEVLKNFPTKCIDLIYIDPPFFSNRIYEIIWGNGAELRAFEDRWKGGINVYIEWMRERLEQCFMVLKDTGLIYLHCDWHASHYLKVEMDRIFGERNFRNEIVWCYSGGGIPKNNFPNKHDIIFRYSKSDKYTYHPEYRPYTQGTLQRGRTQVKGKYFNVGLRKEGTPVTDWWTDINPIHSPTDKEKLGYPTQKPESLVTRIIRTSSNEGDIVLDPMVGGGTTIAVAHKLKRKWIGIDVSSLACQMSAKRMRNLGVTSVMILGRPITVEQLKRFKPFEFQKWVCDKLWGRISTKKSSDMGIDGYTLNNEPIQVKQSEGIGRNVIDNFETAMRRFKKDKGIIVAFSFGKGAYEEVARAKREENLEIKLIEVKELLKENRNKT